MAARDLDEEQANPREREIPVFTVLKNKCILKNIFLLDNPASLSSPRSQVSAIEDPSGIEEILVVGRHPDCNIKLEHPSISRFHLQINSKPSSRSLFVTDLSSGKKLMPGVKVKLNEGDILSLGSSSRLYQLNWVPYSLAYDVDHPFVPQSAGTAGSAEQEKEVGFLQSEKSESWEDDQGDDPSENLEGLELLFSDENEGSSPSKEEISYYGDLYDPFCKKEEHSDHLEDEIPSIDTYQTENDNCPSIVSFPSPDSRKKMSQEENETTDMNSQKKSDQSIWSRRGKPGMMKVETNQIRRNNAEINVLLQVQPCHEADANVASPGHSEESYTPDKENRMTGFLPMECKSAIFSKRRSMLNSSLPHHGEEKIFTPDKENMSPDTRALRFKMKSGVSEEVKFQNLFKSSPLKSAGKNNTNQEKSSICSLVKENKYENILQARKITSSELKGRGNLGKQSAVLKPREDREPFRPLSLNSPINERADSNKPTAHEVDGRSSSPITYPCYEVDCLNENLKKERKKWTIIVDTGCLLSTQSRKELQLLRGLKGTTMVVPRIVVRELDCMLRQRSFFKRSNEVSSALQWIEDCTSNTKWWIHVQSSAEENTLTPPTPPPPPSYSSPRQWFNSESFTFSPFGLSEITTPTPEDHILECALHFKQAKNDEQLVLLSNDVTLKIKAMADGVICETAEEFRRSLVNPFSKRFLYADSSPRGPTWSCVDDAVLKETYYPTPRKKPTKSGEGVKGLKLILQHNSNFGKISAR